MTDKARKLAELLKIYESNPPNAYEHVERARILEDITAALAEAERAGREELMPLLRSIEFVQPMYNGRPTCPSCEFYGEEIHQHAEGCRLAAALEANDEP